MELNEDIFRGVGIEIELPTQDTFLKVKETLTRIGISARQEKKLFQSCHILHKKGRYAILHFKELFILDGKINTFTEEDKARRNTIVNLLAEWGLLKIVNPKQTEDLTASLSQIKIISFKDKADWELAVKYNIGKK
jgi:hypothetical protein